MHAGTRWIGALCAIAMAVGGCSEDAPSARQGGSARSLPPSSGGGSAGAPAATPAPGGAFDNPQSMLSDEPPPLLQGPPPGSQCATAVVSKTQPIIEFVIDGSGSMCADFNGTTRWQALRGALLAPDQGIVYRLESIVEFGMTLYDGEIDVGALIGSSGLAPSPPCSNGQMGQAGACPRLVQLPPAIENAAAIDAMFPMAQLGGSTPTDRAMVDVIDRLIALGNVPVDTDPPRRFAILATDGAPNDLCVGSAGGDGTAQRNAVLDAVARGADAGVRTFVISLAGDDVALQAHLDEVALKGNPMNPDAKTFSPDTPDALVNVINDIVGSAVGCEVVLNGAVMEAFQCDGMVTLEGQPVDCCVALDSGDGYRCGATEMTDPNGWRLVEPNRIELVGAACDELKQRPEATLEANFPCGVFVPE